MRLLRIYVRVLRLLAPNALLVWTLTVANIALATTQFAEPILFGRVVDTSGAIRTSDEASVWHKLLLLLFARVGFGLFNILCGVAAANGTTTRRNEAFDMVRDTLADAAVIDVNLGNEKSFPLADI